MVMSDDPVAEGQSLGLNNYEFASRFPILVFHVFEDQKHFLLKNFLKVCKEKKVNQRTTVFCRYYWHHFLLDSN